MTERVTQRFTLDPEGGEKFVLHGNNVVASGNDLSYPESLSHPKPLKEQKHQIPAAQSFELLKVPEGHDVSPVMGVIRKREAI